MDRSKIQNRAVRIVQCANTLEQAAINGRASEMVAMLDEISVDVEAIKAMLDISKPKSKPKEGKK